MSEFATSRREIEETHAQDEALLDRFEQEASLAAIEGCIVIVEQSLNTVRAEDDGEIRSVKTSIAAREHVIALLTGYRERVKRTSDDRRA